MVTSAGRNQHAPARLGTVLGIVDAEDRLALDDVDDLVSGTPSPGPASFPGPIVITAVWLRVVFCKTSKNRPRNRPISTTVAVIVPSMPGSA